VFSKFPPHTHTHTQPQAQAAELRIVLFQPLQHPYLFSCPDTFMFLAYFKGEEGDAAYFKGEEGDA